MLGWVEHRKKCCYVVGRRLMQRSARPCVFGARSLGDARSEVLRRTNRLCQPSRLGSAWQKEKRKLSIRLFLRLLFVCNKASLYNERIMFNNFFKLYNVVAEFVQTFRTLSHIFCKIQRNLVHFQA